MSLKRIPNFTTKKAKMMLFKSQKSNPPYKEYTSYANLAGNITITVPGSNKLNPMEEHKDLIVKMIKDGIIDLHSEFGLSCMIDAWAALSFLAVVGLEEEAPANVFSSLIMNDKVMGGTETDVKIYDFLSTSLSVTSDPFRIGLDLKLSHPNKKICILLELKGTGVLLESLPSSEDRVIRKNTSVFKSPVFLSFYDEFLSKKEKSGSSTK